MNINHLAIFHAVAEEGSVTRAAERLCISQPAVSKQLRELEKTLGMALFHRLSKGVQLTEAGELLLGYSRQLFALEAEAEQALRELWALERGRLRVGASTTIGTYLLPEICAQFSQRYPGIEMQLEIANSRTVEQLLRDNKIDLALTEGPAEATDIKLEVWLEDELVVIAPPYHPLVQEPVITVERLCAEPFIWREVGSGTQAIIEQALQTKGLQVQAAMSLGSTEAIKRAVAAGMGISIVSCLTIGAELAAGTLIVLPIIDFSIYRPLHRLRLTGKYEGRAAREFVKLLKQSITKDLSSYL
ncbi:MAG: LysR family transcriptional regulator [Abitibacteriaceae bacterium]|nr:LysR family transcriptional regulator [Abditibacteriaceae bacterium]